MLSLAAGADGAPLVPAALVADIGAGAYPAVINILLALQRRAKTAEGCRLDVSMTDNLFPFLYWAIGNGLAAGRWPRPGRELVTGGSPRYQIYRTADDRFVAAAPLEDRFWLKFVAMIGLPPDLKDDALDPAATTRVVAAIIRAKTAVEWQARFRGEDVCCSIVATVEEALADPHFRDRGLFNRTVRADGHDMTALPVAIAEEFRSTARVAAYPALGEGNELLSGARPL
jgi:crotonobetainyl-CoA:carnitine CoA-transferase CaiB-like acyl-CoA transferase